VDFELSEEDRAFEREVIEWVDSYVRPNLAQWHTENKLPPDYWSQLGDRGWLLVKYEDGKWHERPIMQLATMYDRISEVSPGAGIAAFANNQLGLFSIYTFGTEEQRQRWLLPATRGDYAISFGNTEPTAGSDVANINLRATLDGDEYVLSGRKMYITNAVEAKVHVISAVTNPDADDPHEGISLFIVPTDAPGLKVQGLRKIVWNPASLAMLSFDKVRIPKENLLGTLNGGFKQIMHIFTTGRIGVASMTMGTAVGALRLAHRRAKRRNVFGGPIWDLQSKRHEFAEMTVIVEAGRLLYQKAAWLRDTGQNYRMAASVAKLYATEKAKHVTQWAAELHGGSGVLEENRIHRYPLDAWGSGLGEGVPEVQRRIVSKLFDEWIEQF
jgi:alkylation response protein AidB-like acyl-CoA dehydrogenase